MRGDNYYETWVDIVRGALSCLNFEDFTWIHLPSSGGYYNQDEFFIICWEYIRYEFIMAKKDKNFTSALKNIG